MATTQEKLQAKNYHSLTFFVPPPEVIYYADGLYYDGGEELFSSELWPENSSSIETITYDYQVVSFVRTDNPNLGVNPKNTWYDWHLVPSSRPVFSPPALTTNYVEIPGYNGYYDLTKALTNNIAGAREGTINFYVMNDYGIWEQRYNELLSYIHGNELRVVLDDYPRFYYQGRWSVEEWVNNNDGICSSVSLGYHLQPGRTPVP